MSVPKYDELFNPVLRALHALGGSGRVEEIDDKVIELLNLPDKDANVIHRGNTTELNYRTAWARNYLKRFGLVENSDRGVWSLTALGLRTESVNISEVKKAVAVRRVSKKLLSVDEDDGSPELSEEWEVALLDVIKQISPDAFERLCQRILRESGFSEVTVEGRSGDGGIDGRGIYKLNGLISTRVIFQSKRYAGSIGSQQIREFKGTMSGRAEKGIFITTGTFTRDAKREAVRDGSPPIDLVEGNDLALLLKELRLGVSIRQVEEIGINAQWFTDL